MICLSPASGPILAVGGGPVGLRKIRTLLDGEAAVDLVSPEAVPELQALAAEGTIRWKRRTAERADFLEHRLALLALPPEETADVLPLAEGTGCLLNCCGAPELGSWALAAQFRWEGFVVGTGSGGGDPAGSAALKGLLRRSLETSGKEKENRP
jgi:precorrin-2 dehydrogenase/sirohydrochlorin ferrochelatase